MTDGREPRIYVETQGFGHVFVTTGTGNNTTVILMADMVN